MGHYYAFCEKHKKCGENRYESTAGAEDNAWADCRRHLREKPEPHGNIYVKYSGLRSKKDGTKARYYTAILKPKI